MSGSVLVVEDDAVARSLLVEVLERDGHQVRSAPGADAALQLAAEFRPGVVVTDIRMPGMDGLELLRRLKSLDGTVQVIVVTAFGSLASAIEAIRSGAFDYSSKPFSMEEISRMVRRALDARTERPPAPHEPPPSDGEMIGRSPAITEVYKAIARVAPLKVSVLVQGETGAGKDLVARAIHDAGARAERPYVAVNCPSLPEGLLESEIFGHVRGSFTGATGDRAGLFEAAEGGTLLLDEIGDMPLAVQAKLLRVLETGEVRRVGASTARRVDVRVLAATHRDIEREVERGTFRQDLLYRLNAVTIHVPALRDRPEDIPVLAEHLLARHARAAGRLGLRFGDGVVRLFEGYAWPGNVRELSHVIERAVALAGGRELHVEDLPPSLRHAQRVAPVPAEAGGTLEDVERAHILAVLKRVGGVRSQAATALGIDRKTLYRKLRAYGLAEGEGEGEEAYS